MPQKQPPATTAVSLPGAVALASSTAGAGTGFAPPLRAWHARVAANTVKTMESVRKVLDIETSHLTLMLSQPQPSKSEVNIPSGAKSPSLEGDVAARLKPCPSQNGSSDSFLSACHLLELRVEKKFRIA